LAEASVASGDKNGNFEEITVPVAQAPVATLVSLPAKCVVPGKGEIKLTGRLLSEAWRGPLGTNTEGAKVQSAKEEEENYDPGTIRKTASYAKETWGALLEDAGYEVASAGEVSEAEAAEAGVSGSASEKLEAGAAKITAGHFWDGGGCSAPITLEVRSAVSGTSYAFKNYLNLDTRDLYLNAKSKFFDTYSVWAAYAADGPSWISEVSTSGKSEGGTHNNEKGSQEAEATASAPGSLGYANTADGIAAKFTNEAAANASEGSAAHQIVYALAQTNIGATTEGKEAAKYSNPVKSKEAGKETGNCQTETTVKSDRNPPYSYKDSWFGLTAEDPNIAEDVPGAPGSYPICALTYDLIWHHYNVANLWTGETAKEVAHTVKDLMKYITGKAGQEAIDSHYYDGIPTTSRWSNIVSAEISEVEPN
jgi:hypothetical protein